MVNKQNLENIFKKIIIWGSVAVVAVPLIVIKESYFPYIIQKTLILRIIIEFIFGCYLILALSNSEFRPKKSIILWSLVAFFIVMIITTLTSQSIDRSWWGNWERMMGTFTYLHYFVWFVALTGTLKDKKDWRVILNFAILVSIIMSVYSILQRFGSVLTLQSGLERVNGTTGNASYLASYVLFHLFLALFFFLERPGIRWKVYYFIAFLLNLFVLILTGTRGAVLALVGSIFGYLIISLFLKNWRGRTNKILLITSFVLIVGSIFVYFFKDLPAIKDNYWLKRISSYSIKDNTTQTRLRSWSWGLMGFRDNLLFGVGPENYQIVFNKNFTPDFYDYTGDEVWFDRSHNIYVDMASTMGIFGILTYLGIFGAAFYSLHRLWKNNTLNANSFIILFLLFLSYFIQNIFVFDSLNNLIPFHLFLAYIVYLISLGSNEKDLPKLKIPQINLLITSPIILLLTVIIIFNLNIPEIKANKSIFNAIVAKAYNNYPEMVNNYRQAYNLTTNKFDPGVLLSSDIAEMIQANTANVSKQQEIQDLELAAGWLDEAISQDPENMFLYYIQAKNYSMLTELSRESKYLTKGLEYTNKAKQLSPGNIRPLWVEAQFYLFAGQPDKAIAILDDALKLNPRVRETYFYKSVIYDSKRDEVNYYKQLDKLIDTSFPLLGIDQVVSALPHYEGLNDMPRIIYLLGEATRLAPNDPNNWNSLVSYLIKDKQYDRALAVLQDATKAIPAFTDIAYKYYYQIKNLINATTTKK